MISPPQREVVLGIHCFRQHPKSLRNQSFHRVPTKHLPSCCWRVKMAIFQLGGQQIIPCPFSREHLVLHDYAAYSWINYIDVDHNWLQNRVNDEYAPPALDNLICLEQQHWLKHPKCEFERVVL